MNSNTNYLKSIYLLIILLLSFTGTAQKVYELTVQQHRELIDTSYFQIFVDTSLTLEFDDIKLRENEFSAYGPSKKINKKHSQWFRIEVRNTSSLEHDWFFIIGYADLAEVYIPHKNGKVEHYKMGSLMKASEIGAEIDGESFITRLASQEQKTIYIRFLPTKRSTSRLIPKVQELTAYRKSIQKENLIQGVFHGLLWMMLFYNLVLFLSVRDWSYLYYVLYVGFMSFFFFGMFGYARNYVFTDSPSLLIVFVSSHYVAFIFYFALLRVFSSTSNVLKKYDKWFKAIIIYNVVSVVAYALLSVTNFDLYLTLVNFHNVIIVLSLLVFSVLLFRKGDKLARYFVGGSVLMMLGSAVIVAAIILGYQPMLFVYYFQLGIVGEVIVFSLGLSYRFKLNEKERLQAQEELISQLKENDRIKDEANRQLEQKVEERTYQLKESNEELNQTNDQLQQNIELVNTQKAQLEDKNRQITDSITYASRIQSAILGDISSIENQFAEAFIFFSPHSIVSGDFYWYAEVRSNESGDVIKIIVAADCTGHGVPGAFMTVMGHDFLEEIVKNQQITQPDRILSELDRRVTQRLQKQNSDKQVNDGMDITVLAFDEQNKKVYFSGAKNPLYYVRNGEMQVIKGSKFTIGGNQIRKAKKEFTLHELDTLPNDVFYIFSDGFQDQFNPKGYKYMTKNFRGFLHKNSNHPLHEQKQKLGQELQRWKGDQHQTDDILIVGIHIG